MAVQNILGFAAADAVRPGIGLTMSESPVPPPSAPRSPRPPRDYRPDLRPILILAGLLLAVVLGWLFISPLILPPVR